jgi:hypothetical protein
MKRILACIVLVLVAFPTVAFEGVLMRLQGWIVDSRCGAKNAREDRAEDTLACYKDGAKLVFLAKDGKIYDIADQERAVEHIGQQVSVFGTVDGAMMLTVGRYIGREKKKEPQDKGGISPAGAPARPR